MPIYTYKCPKCSNVTDLFVATSDKDAQVCEVPIIAEDEAPRVCGALLQREEISLPAKMGQQWGSWNTP